MMSFLLIYLSISVVAGAVVMYFIAKSPEGWEDKEGFHYLHLQQNEKSVKKVSFGEPALNKSVNNQFVRKSGINGFNIN